MPKDLNNPIEQERIIPTFVANRDFVSSMKKLRLFRYDWLWMFQSIFYLGLVACSILFEAYTNRKYTVFTSAAVLMLIWLLALSGKLASLSEKLDRVNEQLGEMNSKQ